MHHCIVTVSIHVLVLIFFVTIFFFFSCFFFFFVLCSILTRCCCLFFFLISWMCCPPMATVFGSNAVLPLPPSPPPALGLMKPSDEPVVPRGPQLSPLSPRSSSCFSPVLPWCRPNPSAANRKPERRRHLSERQLRHGGGRG